QKYPNQHPLSGQFLAQTRAIFCSPGKFLPEESCLKEWPERVTRKGCSKRVAQGESGSRLALRAFL
ncbi:hypothetical protein, partial [Shewanella algae]|uniref:hypothetical protein n=1 Tax=Shewanella algae TaxID=38313 RepID=UPI002555AA0F